MSTTCSLSLRLTSLSVRKQSSQTLLRNPFRKKGKFCRVSNGLSQDIRSLLLITAGKTPSTCTTLEWPWCKSAKNLAIPDKSRYKLFSPIAQHNRLTDLRSPNPRSNYETSHTSRLPSHRLGR